MRDPAKSVLWTFSRPVAIAATAFLVIAGGAAFMSRESAGDVAAAPPASQVEARPGYLKLTAVQRNSLSIETVAPQVFREELVTEGKVAVDEDHSTSIFSPYAGRVTSMLVGPGDAVEKGQPLFVLEAADAVQAQNEFMNAAGQLNKARSQATLAASVERRLHNLYEAKATSLREWQQAQADLVAAQNDLESSKITLEAMRNRLRMLGKTDTEIGTFQQTGVITPDAAVFAPLSGTVISRRMGPGQYIAAGANDPVFVVGDLSTVWLVAYIRESDASKVRVGQPIRFNVLAHPGREYEARIAYVATSIDPQSRRREVRATIANPDAALAPGMFATVSVAVKESGPEAAVPREAVIYEAGRTHVWVENDDGSMELRAIRLGLTSGRMIQVLEGVAIGERFVTKGNLFIERMVANARS